MSKITWFNFFLPMLALVSFCGKNKVNQLNHTRVQPNVSCKFRKKAFLLKVWSIGIIKNNTVTVDKFLRCSFSCFHELYGNWYYYIFHTWVLAISFRNIHFFKSDKLFSGNYISNSSKREEEDEFTCPIGDGDKYSVKIIPTDSPKFDPGDAEASKYLEANGYVVFRQVATDEEVKIAIDLFWKLIESETNGKVLAI